MHPSLSIPDTKVFLTLVHRTIYSIPSGDHLLLIINQYHAQCQDIVTENRKSWTTGWYIVKSLPRQAENDSSVKQQLVHIPRDCIITSKKTPWSEDWALI